MLVPAGVCEHLCICRAETSFLLSAAQEAGPSQYRNKQQGYSLERPQAWEQTSKAGADVLFVNPARKSTTLGVTVSPIRINSLDKFGSLETVRDKLLATEKAKVSSWNIVFFKMVSCKSLGPPCAHCRS